MVKEICEWFIDIFCGKVALVSWGEATNPPILLVHGYMDTAATYIPLLELLPDDYYYIGFDMPGHGKSDPFPPGSISQLYLVEIINQIVLHMQWKSFIYMGHSLGGFVGMIYNHLYPNKISKCIYLDPAKIFSVYYYQIFNPDYLYFYMYDKYYQNYERHQSSKFTLYTIDEAINSIVRSRDFSEKQAAIVLSRSLVPAGGDKYALSWDPRSKRISPIPLSEDMLYEIITRRTVPTLIINAKKNHITDLAFEFTTNIMEKFKHIPDYTSIEVDGGHDVHVTNPELLADHVTKFLRKKFRNESLSSKL